MTITSEISRVTRSWTGVETTFPTGMRASDPAHVLVTTAAGATLTRGTQYGSSIDGAGLLVITPIALPAAPQTLFIERVTPALQPDDWVNGDSFDAELLERRLDEAAMRDAELRAIANRSISVPSGEAGFTIDTAAIRAGKVQAYDVGGAPISVPLTGSMATILRSQITDSSVLGRTLMAVADAAAARAALTVPTVTEMTTADAVVAATAAKASSRLSNRLDLDDRKTQTSSPMAPTWAFYETGALFPGIYPWQNLSDVAAPITEAFIRETIRAHGRLGIETIILLPGAEKLGYFQYTPSFAYWFDQQWGRTASHWTSLIWTPAGDVFRWMLDECEDLGMKLVIGHGKNGDDYLAVDLAIAGAGVTVATSPTLAAIAKTTRTTQAISRACQVGQDLWNQYGAHPAFGGFYCSHEPDHIDLCTPLMKGIIADGGGGFPALNSYRYPDGRAVPVWVSPADVDDFPLPTDSAAIWEAKAATLRSWGMTDCAPQDVVGTGENSSGVPTWNPANRLSMMRGYAGQWRRLVDTANHLSLSRNQSISLGWNLELFQQDGPTYTNPYPAAFTRVQEQIAKVADQGAPVGAYGVFPFAMPIAGMSMRLPQVFYGKADFRTRANALNAGLLGFRSNAVKRQEAAHYALPRCNILRDVVSRNAPANATTLFTIGKYYPASDTSRALIRVGLWINRAYQASLTGASVTFYPTINGVAQVPDGGTLAAFEALMHGLVEAEFEWPHEGLAFEVGWSINVLTATPAITVTWSKAVIMEVRS